MNNENQKTILLVEDEILIAMAEKMILKKHKFNVIISNTGENAVEIIGKTPDIDLVLMDIDLGNGIDGTQAAGIILEKRDLPVIFLSSHTEYEVVEKTEGITSYGYIVKNSGETVLIASIKMAFRLFDAKMKAKEKENALRKSETTLLHAQRVAHVGSWEIDMNTKRVVASEETRCIYGLEGQEWTINEIQVVPLPEYRSLLDSALRGLIEQELSYDIEFRIRRTNDGEFRDIHSVAEYDRERNIIIGTLQDITDRKIAEEKLKERNQFIESLINLNPNIIYIYDLIDKINVYSNDGIHKILGYTAEEIKEFGSTVIYSLMHPDDFDYYSKNILPGYIQAKDNEIISHIYRMKHKNGEWGWLESNECIYKRLHDGKPHQIFGVIQDITERRRAEDVLRENENRFRRIAAITSDIAYSCRTGEDGSFAIDWITGAVSRITGYSCEDIREQGCWRFLVVEEDIDLFEKNVIGLAPGFQGACELRIRNKNGGVVWVSSFAECVPDPQIPDRLLIYGGLADISERKRAYVEIKRQLSEKEILLKEVHHRIKNNIASVGSLLLLQLQSITNPEAVSALKNAIGRVNSMRLLYDKLLLTEGYKDISVKNYIESLIDTVVTLYSNNSNITLDKRIDDFHLDTKKLFPLGVIINELITNIMKYSFVNRDAGLIQIILTKADKHVKLTIQDNGNGPPDGFDIKDSNGFGLMIVKMLSQQLGGNFIIEKHEGTRCIFEYDI